MNAPTAIYNLCSNPRMLAEHCKPTNCTIGMTSDGGSLWLTATDNSSNAFVELPPIDVSKLNGVTLRCAVETDGSGTVSLPAICYMRFPDNGQLIGPNAHLKGTSWTKGKIIWNATVPSGMKTMVPVVTAPADRSKSAWWARMIVSTVADATTLSNVTGKNYFDGSTRPE